MMKSGWEQIVQVSKRLRTVSRKVSVHFKFWWQGFCSSKGWKIKLLPVFLQVPLIILFCTTGELFWAILFVALCFPFWRTYVVYRNFQKISPHIWSLGLDHKQWEGTFKQLLQNREEAIPIFLQILKAKRKSFLFVLWGFEKACLLSILGLGRLKAGEGVEILLRLLKTEDLEMDDDYPLAEKIAAIWALGEIGDQKATPALIPFLGDFQSTPLSRPLSRFLRDEYEPKRLEEIRKAFMEGIPATQWTQSDRFRWKVCDWAEEALTKLNPQIVTLFRKVVEEQDKDALFELSKGYRSEMIAALIGVLDNQEEDWVFNAVWALRKLKAVDALPKLRRLARKAGLPSREYCQKVVAELEMFSRLPRAVSASDIDLAKLPAIPDTNSVLTENLPRAAKPDEKEKPC